MSITYGPNGNIIATNNTFGVGGGGGGGIYYTGGNGGCSPITYTTPGVITQTAVELLDELHSRLPVMSPEQQRRFMYLHDYEPLDSSTDAPCLFCHAVNVYRIKSEHQDRSEYQYVIHED